MPRPKNTHERRQQIVAAMRQVMTDKGYEGATIVAIAKQAGLRSGLVHYHFKSKQAILLALIEQLQDTADARLGERLKKAGQNPRKQLEAWIDAQLASGSDAAADTLSAWLFIAAEAVRQPEVETLFNRVQQKRLAQVTELVRTVLVAECRQQAASSELGVLLLAAVEGCFRLRPDSGLDLRPGYAAPLVKEAARRWLDQTPALDDATALGLD